MREAVAVTDVRTRRARRAAERADEWPTGSGRGRHRGEPAEAPTPVGSRPALLVTAGAAVVTVGGTFLVLALSAVAELRWGLAVAGRGSHLVLGPWSVGRSDAVPLAAAAAAVPLVLAQIGRVASGSGQSRGRRGARGATVAGAVLSVAVAANLLGCFAASAAGARTDDDAGLVAAMVAPQLVLLAAVLGLGALSDSRRRRMRRESRAQDRPAVSS
jgi:hypothetical protein